MKKLNSSVVEKLKSSFYLSTFLLFNLSTAFATPLQWTCNWPDARPQTFSLYQGETATFEPTFRVNGQLATNVTIDAVWYQTNGMGNAWWKLDGATFAPSNDVGAAAYRFFVEGKASSDTIYRANGTLRMLPSPGFTPNEITMPVATLDFSGIEVLNAPWPEEIEAVARGVASNELAIAETARGVASNELAIAETARQVASNELAIASVARQVASKLDAEEYTPTMVIPVGLYRLESVDDDPSAVDADNLVFEGVGTYVRTRSEFEISEDSVGFIIKAVLAPARYFSYGNYSADEYADSTGVPIRFAIGDIISIQDSLGSPDYMCMASNVVQELPPVLMTLGQSISNVVTKSYVEDLGYLRGEYAALTNNAAFTNAVAAVSPPTDISGKQDKLPYATNAIPYAAISGKPTIPTVPTAQINAATTTNALQETAISTLSDSKLDKSGGTVTGNLTLQNTLIANYVNVGGCLFIDENADFGFDTHEGGVLQIKPSRPIAAHEDVAVQVPVTNGTLALTSDIPTVPTNVSAFSNDAGYLTSYTESDPTVPDWAKSQTQPLPPNYNNVSNRAMSALQSYTESDPTISAWAKASTKPSYTASEVGAVPTSRTVNGKALSSNVNLDASDVGAYSSADGTSLANIVNTWEGYWDGTNVIFEVTNYYGNTSGEIPRLRIKELREGVWQIVWDEANKFQVCETNIMSNVVAYVTGEVGGVKQYAAENFAPVAWGTVTDKGTTNVVGNSVWMTAPETYFAGGTEYQRVAVGSGMICVLTDNGALAKTTGEPGTFRFQDEGGTNYFGFAKSDSYTIGCNTDGIVVEGTLVTLRYDVIMGGGDVPIVYWRQSLTSGEWVQLNNADGTATQGAPYTVTWYTSGGSYYAAINCGANASGFFKAETSVAGDVVFETNMKMRIDGGLSCTNTATGVMGVIRPTYNGSSVSWTWSAE